MRSKLDVVRLRLVLRPFRSQISQLHVLSRMREIITRFDTTRRVFLVKHGRLLPAEVKSWKFADLHLEKAEVSIPRSFLPT